jgi:hypothetical protein
MRRSILDARYHPYSTPNTSKSSSSPSSLSTHDISAQSDLHPALTSSPCSSVFDASSPSQPPINTNLDSSAKENNYSPSAYYPEPITTHLKGENEYPAMENNQYPNEHFAYSRKSSRSAVKSLFCKFVFRCLSIVLLSISTSQRD